MDSQYPPIHNLLIRLWKLLSSKRRKQLAVLLFLMLVSAFAEVVSLGAIIPFLAVLTAPDELTRIPLVSPFLEVIAAQSGTNLTLVLTIIFATAALAAALLRISLLWTSNRIGQAMGYDLSVTIFEKTLHQPYQSHVSQNSSEIISGISKINNVTQVILQCLNASISFILLSFILIAIFVIDAYVAIFSILTFGTFYILVSMFTRRTLRSNSVAIAVTQTRVLKIIQESLGGIRDIILAGSNSAYVTEYKRAEYPLRMASAHNAFIAGSPRYLMEGAGIAMIAFLAYMLSLDPNGIGPSLPVLGALALGAQRLLPVLQQLYASFAVISGSKASLCDAIVLLEQPVIDDTHLDSISPLALEGAIRFENVCFGYDSENSQVLNGVSFEVQKGARIGIAGPTGSGKSTLMDLTMGLISPTSGKILVNGKALEGANLKAWQRAIAHVPQDLFLTDSSFAENIAIGKVGDEIDMERVKHAAKQAQIASFIEACPNQYNQLVGERGLKLSGGQRQRIGIARALYKQASVIVFDEATSALDTETEKAVMQSIESLSNDLTIFIIAHRLTTLDKCTHKIELRTGGTAKLMTQSPPLSRNDKKLHQSS